MSFFNTDYATNQMIDEAWWGKQPPYKDPKQTEIQFFYPLTEQIELDLDYGPTHLHYRAKGIAGVHSMPILGTVHEFTTVSTNINPQPQLTITPNNSVGDLSIGNIRVGLEKRPTWIQRQLHKLLGFNWKDK